MAKRTEKNEYLYDPQVNIFDVIRELSTLEPRSYSWYRDTIDAFARTADVTRSIFSLQDLMVPSPGQMYFFEYQPYYAKRLFRYDTFPLVYVIRLTQNGFYGANLHYLSVRGRMDVVLSLEGGKMRFPKKTLHAYRFDAMVTPLMQINNEDWKTALFLPVERFVTR